MVVLIIVINVAVFGLWYSDYFGIEWMYYNFLVSWEGLEAGRYWTLLSSVFSHNMLLHLFVNMFVLHSFGRLVEAVLGSFRFLRFFIFAGIFSSLCHALTSKFILDSPDLPALGASGAIAGVMLIFALMFPREKILLMGIIPMPAIFGAFAFIGLDIWGLIAQSRGGGLPIGHGAHLGGAFAGLAYYLIIIRPRLKSHRETIEQV